MSDYIVNYGRDGRLELRIDDEQLVGSCGQPSAEPLDDPVAAVAAALVEPLDYPPLAEATFPGDHIVLAVERGIPQVELVVAGVIKTLREAGLADDQLCVVTAPGASSIDSIAEFLQSIGAGQIPTFEHNPVDRTNLAYLAATKSGQQVLINRLICDADLVITIGCLRSRHEFGYLGVHGGVYPTFADSETCWRFANPAVMESPDQRRKMQSEVDEACWLLGGRFTVQVIPGPGDSILQVLAGDIDSVAVVGEPRSDAAWRAVFDRRAELVVAAVEGCSTQQSWDNVARSLSAALRIVEDGGAVVVCTELDVRPGPALIAAMDETNSSSEDPFEDGHAEDAVAAAQLGDAMKRVRVYLLSNLDADLLEHVGITPVESPKQISNLCQRHGSCILMANAHRVRPSVHGELAKT